MEQFRIMMQEMRDSQLRVEERMKAGEERFARIEEETEHLHEELHGNGKPGLKQHVHELMAQSRWWSKAGWLLFGAMAPIVGGGIAAAAWFMFKKLP